MRHLATRFRTVDCVTVASLRARSCEGLAESRLSIMRATNAGRRRERFRSRAPSATPADAARSVATSVCRAGCADRPRVVLTLLGLAASAAVAAVLLAAHRAGGRLSQPARDRQPDRLPAEAADARLLGRRRAARRIRRGAAQLHADRADPEGDAGRRARHRGRALLRAQRRRLQGRASAPAWPTSARRAAPGRLDHHDAGGAQLLPLDRENLYSQDLRDAAGAEDREPAHARSRSSRST